MATYKGIQGYSVQKLSSDPTASEAVGQLWYNSASGKFKIGTEGAGAWASIPSMNTARQFVGGAGTYNAGLVAGGETTVAVKVVEEYNGTAWSEVNDLLTAKYNPRGFGDSTEACYMVGGRDPNTADTESFDGTSWTEVANLPATTNNGIAVGPSSYGLYAFGYNGGYVAETYEWDGTSWSHTVNASTGRVAVGGTGTQTAALAFGGAPAGGDATESYNGTSWTNMNTLNTSRKGLGGSSFGRVNTSALAFGGESPPGSPNSVLTEKWDGTSWTEVGDLSTSNVYGAGLGTVSNAISAAGQGLIATAEEWSDPVYTIKTVTVS